MQLNISLAPETLFTLGGFPVTNSMLGMLLAAGLLILLARRIGRHADAEPSKLQAGAELVMEFLLGLMDSVTNDRALSKKFFPWVSTIFFFIIAMNWLSLVPIFGTIGFNEVEEGRKIFVPFFRAGTADLNMTLAIALIVQIAVQVFGVAMIGWKKYGGKFFVISKNPVNTFVGFIEFISEFTKVISFSFRLFGNVFAGEVLLLIIGTLVPLFAPLPFYFLELFVGFIQAFVFALLALVFFQIAVTVHEDHAAEAQAAH